MSDIFLSYSRKDIETAKTLAGALERRGWSVWWDKRIPTGKEFADVIEEQITGARCVIVLWSDDSVKSDWVQNEAAHAKDRGCLLPVMIEPVKIPFEFRRIQAADLTDWKGEGEHPGLATLVNDLTDMLGVRPTPEPPVEKPRPAPPVEESRDTDAPELPTGGGEEGGGADEVPLTDEVSPDSVEVLTDRRKPDDDATRGVTDEDEKLEFLSPPEPVPPKRTPLIIGGVAVAAVVIAVIAFAVASRNKVNPEAEPTPTPKRISSPPDGPTASPTLPRGMIATANATPSPEQAPTATPMQTPPPSPDLKKIPDLFKAVSSPNRAERRRAMDTLRGQYSSEPAAVEYAAGLLNMDDANNPELSPQGVINLLDFLNTAKKDAAWNRAAMQKVEAGFAALEKRDLFPEMVKLLDELRKEHAARRARGVGRND